MPNEALPVEDALWLQLVTWQLFSIIEKGKVLYQYSRRGIHEERRQGQLCSLGGCLHVQAGQQVQYTAVDEA